MNHWATQYIGLPWRRGATGPQAFDCWGLVVQVQATRFNVAMPSIAALPGTLREVAAAIAEHRQGWSQVDTPKEGDVVLMSRTRIPMHIGVWIIANGHGGVLHCSELAGVTFNRAQALRAQGWGHVTYWRRNG